MPTTLDEELREQARWEPKPTWAGSRVFQQIIRNEFLSVEHQAARMDAAVARLLRYADSRVPYYRNLLKHRGLTPDDIDGVRKLSLLPQLTKSDVQRASSELRSDKLPEGEEIASVLRSSGTTGEPVAIAHTRRSRMMFALMKQREMRWFRFDPHGTLAHIRSPSDLPRSADGQRLQPGETIRMSGWVQVSGIFQTGPFLGFSDQSDIGAQLEWLHREQPNYLLSNAAQLEHLALSAQDAFRFPTLRGLTAVSQQLTPEMRHRIEQTFSVPVYQNYGLNEIGIVAVHCPEGGRYHVHTEHCVVEIVDEDGRPCGPGEKGKVLVTAFSNAAMPLVRYDADDMAVVAEGPCPCGRSLPAFADIVGRYRRTAFLPPGTWGYWVKLLHTLHQDLPANLTGVLRKYQLHQFRDHRFELRLVVSGDNGGALVEWVQAAWNAYAGPDGHPLSIRVVADIPRPRGGKFQNFTSDFVPPDPSVDQV